MALQDEKGQGLVEYAIILVLIVVLILVLLAFFGTGVGDIYSNIVSTI